MLDLVRCFSCNSDNTYREVSLLHTSCSFSKVFLLAHLMVVLVKMFLLTHLMLVLVRCFPYAPSGSFSDEFLLHS